MKNKKTAMALVAFALALLTFSAIYLAGRTSGTDDSKRIYVTVVDAEEKEDDYALTTEAQYLRGALDELSEKEDFSYDGIAQSAGFMILEINGKEAVYEKDGSFWSIYLNGEYAQFGIADQPISDGDHYTFVIEKV